MKISIKAVFGILFLFVSFVGGSCGFGDKSVTAESRFSDAGDGGAKEKRKAPVLVELFTSQGCSSCPPAERLLDTIDTEQPYDNAEVVTLELHVDYWDRLGWKDEFSSAIFSRRQDIYAQAFRSSEVYTPQMVVDGRSEFVGSNAGKAAKAINENASNEKALIEIAFEMDKLRVKISEIPDHENATVYLAIAENGLTTDVRGGENSGKLLKHISVVRELKTIGTLVPGQMEFSFEQALSFQPMWKTENLRLVVFLQENQSRKIFGVGRAEVD